MNIDGATGVVFAELGFPPPLCRGLFVLSRSVGALAHAFEEMQSGQRNKGPIPRHLIWTYTGPPPPAAEHAVWPTKRPAEHELVPRVRGASIHVAGKETPC